MSGKSWDRIVSPQDESLKGVAHIVGEQVEQGREVVVNSNNHYEGCAPMTIQRIIESLF